MNAGENDEVSEVADVSEVSKGKSKGSCGLTTRAHHSGMETQRKGLERRKAEEHSFAVVMDKG